MNITAADSKSATRVVNQKDIRKFLISLIEGQGATAYRTKSGHLMVLHPNGVGKFLVSGTPKGGQGALKKIKADAQKEGFAI